MASPWVAPLRRRSASVTLLASLLLPPLQALAQEGEEPGAAAGQSEYAISDSGWKSHRFYIGGFGGQMNGGTSLGLTENVFFRTEFNTGDDTLWGGRVGWVFAPRFELELELGRSSPGLVATLTDLQGKNKTEVEFADLRITYLMAVVNYSMIERGRRLVPYLSLGIGTVRADSDDEKIVRARKPGIIFGGGLRIRVIEALALRADVRGMRSGFGAKQQDVDDLPGVFVGDYNASHLLWSFGLDIRF